MELLVCLNSRHSAIKALLVSLANTVSPSPPPPKKN